MYDGYEFVGHNPPAVTSLQLLLRLLRQQVGSLPLLRFVRGSPPDSAPGGSAWAGWANQPGIAALARKQRHHLTSSFQLVRYK